MIRIRVVRKSFWMVLPFMNLNSPSGPVRLFKHRSSLCFLAQLCCRADFIKQYAKYSTQILKWKVSTNVLLEDSRVSSEPTCLLSNVTYGGQGNPSISAKHGGQARAAGKWDKTYFATSIMLGRRIDNMNSSQTNERKNGRTDGPGRVEK